MFNIMSRLHEFSEVDQPSVARPVELRALDGLFELAPTLSEQMQTTWAARGLTLSRAALLWQLNVTGPAIQRELSDALGVVPRTVTAMVDDLVAARLVQRRPHPRDRRARVVILTGAGHGAVEAMQMERRAFAAQLFDGIPAADVAAVASTLAVLTGRLRHIAMADDNSATEAER